MNPDIRTFIERCQADPVMHACAQTMAPGSKALIGDMHELLPDYNDRELGEIMVAFSLMLRGVELVGAEGLSSLKTYLGVAAMQLYHD